MPDPLKKRRIVSAFLLALLPAGPALADGIDTRIGEALFRRMWVTAPTVTLANDGLGPLYNARSCATCHPRGSGGRPPDPDAPGEGIGYTVKLNDDPVYGRQIQSNAVFGLAVEGRPKVQYREETARFPDGETVRLRRPILEIADLGYGPLAETTVLSGRVAPRVHGMGLLDRIPEADILAGADPDDRDGDGIRGRPNYIVVDGVPRLGRFGLKATHPTLNRQNAEAFSLDIGMSTPAFRAAWGDCTPVQTACREAHHGDSPQFEDLEIPSTVIALIDGYLRDLPPNGGLAPPKNKAGATLFAATGCASCHRPSFTTAEDPAHPALSKRTVFLYSDLLLHDLGDDLADGVTMGEARGRDWRTAPLWGLNRLAKDDGRLSLLHDGRARSVAEAVLWHGGEAAPARSAFMNLTSDERRHLVRFVLGL